MCFSELMELDAFFISHGSPLLSVDDSLPARPFLKSWQRLKVLPRKPSSILVISAHWETDVPTVNVLDRNSLIYDFNNFPRPLYELEYPAPAAPKLARRVKELLLEGGFPDVAEDNSRGLDHGVWVPLLLMYPEADIPVCQLSIQTHLDGAHHYNMGKALAPLRKENVLIFGSGSATHNLRAPPRRDGIHQWALDFDEWLEDSLLNGRHDDVIHYEEKAPHALMNHPEPDHFYPLHVALGAAGPAAKAELIHRSWEDGSLSYSSFRFSTVRPARIYVFLEAEVVETTDEEGFLIGSVMGAAAVEKTAEELRKEIDELQRQQWEITERLRDPRGIRRGGLAANGVRGNGPRQRGVVRPADRIDPEDEPAAKRRLSSAVVKVGDGVVAEAAEEKEANEDLAADGGAIAENVNDRTSFQLQRGGLRRSASQRIRTADAEIPASEHLPRVLPKNEDPSLVKRNRRMLGQLLGTLEKFRQEDRSLSSSDAFMRRSDSLKRAEERAREESERLRLQEREQLAEKRRRDLTLRARVAAKAEEKKLELLFLQWTEHHKKLCNFLRTKAQPSIFYQPVKPLEEDVALSEQQKEQAFQEWKSARREELSEYQKQIGDQYIANVEAELERWRNARNARKSNNLMNLQETMDKELETHRLEHGPKTRKIPGGTEDDEDVEDIAGEDDMMDDVLGVDDSNRRADDPKPEVGNSSPGPEEDVQ
ncbi:hypothetical protein H6P81_011103 [Aristolochia fimbriata]|uniref:Stizolobate synthase n=1 Tax=Aristolochia fimbriata TaxID=158543 RepID=A0AAV7EQX0_ARIFI|nr:hypothetical protein H6P81_011103 [Aristolochia fimbriata]